MTDNEPGAVVQAWMIAAGDWILIPAGDKPYRPARVRSLERFCVLGNNRRTFWTVLPDGTDVEPWTVSSRDAITRAEVPEVTRPVLSPAAADAAAKRAEISIMAATLEVLGLPIPDRIQVWLPAPDDAARAIVDAAARKCEAQGVMYRLEDDAARYGIVIDNGVSYRMTRILDHAAAVTSLPARVAA